MNSQTTENNENTVARWRDMPATASNRSVMRTWIPRVLLLLIVCVAGMLIGLFSLIRESPQTTWVPIWVTVPVGSGHLIHAPVVADRIALSSKYLLGSGGDAHNDAAENTSAELRLANQLKQLDMAKSHEPVLMYISSLAFLNKEGRVILETDSLDETQTSDSGYPLSKVLRKLQVCEATDKLLVLDICWPNVDASAAKVDSDVAGKLQQEINAVNDEQLVVISSCSPGQFAQAIFDPSRTVFGYFFEQGLRGKADGFGSHRKDGRVSTDELANYLTNVVDAYSQKACSARQTPWLVGSGKSFDLISCSMKQMPAASHVVVEKRVAKITEPESESDKGKGKDKDKDDDKKQADARPTDKSNAQKTKTGDSEKTNTDVQSVATPQPQSIPKWLVEAWQSRDQLVNERGVSRGCSTHAAIRIGDFNCRKSLAASWIRHSHSVGTGTTIEVSASNFAT